MKRLIVLLFVSFVALDAMAQATTQPVSKPTTVIAQAGCVTSGCHANVKQYQVLHGPVNVNACDACHKLTDPSQHTFELSREKIQLCTFCHQVDTHGDQSVHGPLKRDECLLCHDPHGGTTVKSLRGKTVADNCKLCHVDKAKDKSTVHGPVAAGACLSCHKGHSSPNPKLLVATGNDLCFTCHVEMKTQMAKVQFKHKAVEQDCTKCHDAHASNYPMQIKQPPAQLCTSCHEHDKIKTAAMDSKFKHSPVVNDKACLNCHTAHGGDLAKLMRTDQMKVCMKCHAEPQVAGDGRKVASVAEVLDPNMNKHGPIRDKSCSGCHNPHGSEVAKLLAKPYPETFYKPFAEKDYDLCFSCHNKQLVTLEKTTGLTGFRNGDRNLHFVHVNKADRGRTCRACHETHAGPQPLHVRESVPYGNWQLPVNFKRTETGGSCAPGCHKELSYDRNQAVPTTAPATQPSLAGDGAEKQS